MNLKELKVIFMGTPEFSLNVLQALIDNTNVIGVVTQPDKIVGKNKDKSFTPVKELAVKNNILVLQPEKIRKEYEDILALNPDIIVTCAYGQIIPEVILNYPKYGCINVHASLLPKLRGGSPLHHALIDGYDKTGVTIMYMDKGMDTGDIISQEEVIISDEDNVGTIHDKLSLLGSQLLMKTLPTIIDGTRKRIKQDEKEATYCHNITHEEELIDFNKTGIEIFNQVRGMNPYPVSYFVLDNKIFKIYQVKYEKTNKYIDKKNGQVIIQDKSNLIIKVSDGVIKILDLKKEGKKRMLINDYLNGEKEDYEGMICNERNDE
jgi:methionyl-tRNA formyltransferase